MTKHPLSRPFFIASLMLATSLSVVAGAQENRAGMMERLDRLERDLQMLQRNYYRDGAPAAEGAALAAPASAAAHLEVQINDMQVGLRELRGQIEEMEFQQRRLTEQMDVLSKDVGLRLSDLESRAQAPVISPDVTTIDGENVVQGTTNVTNAPMVEPVVTPQPVIAPAVETPATTSSAFENAKDHYNAAFKELNDAQYDSSATLFSSFIKQYPDDSLIGNAYYWLGETYYVRKNYAEAANQFRLGFEKMPEGPKAADNLLKLSMSLSAIDRSKEACVVLNQLIKKYGGSSEVVDRKAKKERTKLACE